MQEDCSVSNAYTVLVHAGPTFYCKILACYAHYACVMRFLMGVLAGNAVPRCKAKALILTRLHHIRDTCLLLEQKGAETKRRTADELKKLQVDLLVARNFHIDKQ